MTVVATSPVAIAKHALRRLVASSATFRNLVGATTEAAAMEHIHIAEAIDDEDEPVDDEEGIGRLADPRPRAIIDMTGNSVPKLGVAEYQDQYEFALSFEFTIPNTVTRENPGKHLLDESTWFDNQWSQIVEDMKANNGGQSPDEVPYFFFTNIELAGGPARNRPFEDSVREYYWGVQLTISGPHG